MSMIEDPNQIFKEAIDKVKMPGASVAELVTSLEIIDRCCDDPDVARNVEKLDGLQALLDLVETHSGSVQVRSLEILALLLANNPNIQELAMKRRAMKVFKNRLEQGSEVRPKAFRALVALVRGVEALEVQFLESGGAEVLLEGLRVDEDSKVRDKALNFVRCLVCEQRLSSTDTARFLVALVPLLPNIAAEEMQYRETFAACAMELLRAAPSECPSELADAMRGRLAQIQTGEDFAAERDIVQECVSALQ